jgi:hypothetical protein
VHGTPWFGGLGWRHIYFEQGIQHILTIIKHLRTPGSFQSLLRIVLDWHQVIAGVLFSPLYLPSVPIKYIKCPWIDITCNMLLHCSAQLTIPGITLPKPKRVHDECIMEGLSHLNLPAATLERVNACRLWLRVETLSDISTLHGDRIDRIAWLGLGRIPCNDSDWPEQPRPQDTVWGKWRKALSDARCTNDRRYVLASQPGRLTQRLGAWLSDYAPQNAPRWRKSNLVQHSTQWLYHWNRQHEQYERLSTATPLEFGLATYLRPANPILVSLDDIPADAVPAQPTNDGQFLRLNRLHTPDMLASPPLAPPAQSFLDHLLTLPEWQQDLLAGTHLTNGHDSLGQHLLQGDRLFFCSDGGAKDNARSFGWVIATANTIIWECSALPPGGTPTRSDRKEWANSRSWFSSKHISHTMGYMTSPLPSYRLKRNRGYASPLIMMVSSHASRPAWRPPQRSLARHFVPNTMWFTRSSRSNADSPSAFNGNKYWAIKTIRNSGTN